MSTCAPTAWPDSLRSAIAAWTSAKTAFGSSTPTGSGAHIAATWLPSAPRASSARTDTGTIALSTTPSVASPRARRKRPRAIATAERIASLSVPPKAFLTALSVATSPSTQA